MEKNIEKMANFNRDYPKYPSDDIVKDVWGWSLEETKGAPVSAEWEEYRLNGAYGYRLASISYRDDKNALHQRKLRYDEIARDEVTEAYETVNGAVVREFQYGRINGYGDWENDCGRCFVRDRDTGRERSYYNGKLVYDSHAKAEEMTDEEAAKAFLEGKNDTNTSAVDFHSPELERFAKEGKGHLLEMTDEDVKAFREAMNDTNAQGIKTSFKETLAQHSESSKPTGRDSVVRQHFAERKNR